jgi:hypothetical protein
MYDMTPDAIENIDYLNLIIFDSARVEQARGVITHLVILIRVFCLMNICVILNFLL